MTKTYELLMRPCTTHSHIRRAQQLKLQIEELGATVLHGAVLAGHAWRLKVQANEESIRQISQWLEVLSIEETAA
jgi:hypothetical protein